MASRPRRAVAPLEIDRESLLELARGGNLYQERFACVRELIQNAADATLLRVFAERPAESFPTHEGSLAELRALLEAHPIHVEVTRLRDLRGVRRYRVVVEDRGAGIARADVPHLQRVASSRRNPARARIIAAMPEWMRPSGTFGIGLQSVFLVADEVVLDTRSMHGEASCLTLRARDGGTLELREGTRREIGTRVELVAHVSPASERRRRRYFGAGVDEDVDPLQGSLDAVAESVLRVARASGRASLAPVFVQGALVPSAFSGGGAWFDAARLVEIALPQGDGPGVLDAARAPTFDASYREGLTRGHYRGAPLEPTHGTVLAGVALRYNLHAGSAREVLLVGRDVLQERAARQLHERLRAALAARVPDLLRGTDPSARSLRAWLSAHLMRSRHPASGSEWRGIVLGRSPTGDGLTLGRAHELGSFAVHSVRRGSRSELVLPDGASADTVPYPIWDLLADLFPGQRLEGNGVHVYTVRPGRTVAIEHLSHTLLEGEHASLRPILYIPRVLRALCLPAAAREAFELDDHRRVDLRDLMLSPWTFERDRVDLPHALRWIEFTARPGGPRRTRRSVATALVSLLRTMDPLLRASRWTVAYDLEAVIDEIESTHAPPARSRDRDRTAPRRRTRR